MAKIIISTINKEEYSNGSYPEITSIKWNIGYLDENILKNFPNLSELNCSYNEINDLNPLQLCLGLTKLNCSNNEINDLSPLQYCTALTILDCSYNEITDLNPLQCCTALTMLDCNYNRISDLNSLQYCTVLTRLSCRYNSITDLNSLQFCKELVVLDCGNNLIKDINFLIYCRKLILLYCCYNEITDLSSLQYCTGLKNLFFYFNQISDLSSLQYCTELIELWCQNNQITSLEPLTYLRRLNVLWCQSNQITSLEPLIYLRRLNELSTSNNPLNPPSIQVTRFLERIERNNNTANVTSIYNDTQNVHDVKVQQSVMDSVRNLMRDNNVLELDIDSVLTSELQVSTKSRLLEYFEDNDIHVILLITYKELFTYVWNRIQSNPNRLELLKILDDNIQDSECKCFTGRFNRTLSTLVGFYDDIEINISDNSRISAIILQVKDSIIPYDPIKHKELSKIRLLEAGYDSETVDFWISAIE